MRSLVLLAAGTVLASSAHAQSQRSPAPQGSPTRSAPAGVERRDDWQRVPDIFAAAGLTTGSRVADLGSGEGWLTTRLAKQVGPGGRVFAADISENALKQLSRTLGDSITNVELVLSTDSDPRLPYGTLDAVIILNAYHEMTQRVPVLSGVLRALRPGGVLVIVDGHPADTAQRTRQDQTRHHSLAPEFARDDLEAQGFELVSVQPEFINTQREQYRHRQWLIAARKRAEAR